METFRYRLPWVVFKWLLNESRVIIIVHVSYVFHCMLFCCSLGIQWMIERRTVERLLMAVSGLATAAAARENSRAGED